jgi:hypothetical protein
LQNRSLDAAGQKTRLRPIDATRLQRHPAGSCLDDPPGAVQVRGPARPPHPLTDAGEEGEAQVRIGAHDYGLEVVQPIVHGASDLWSGEIVQDGLVVFVHQHDNALAGVHPCAPDQLPETAGNIQIRLRRAAAAA